MVMRLNQAESIMHKSLGSVRTLVIALLGLVSSVAAAQSREVTVTEGFQDPTVAPDGTRIAFALYGKIWLAPTAGGDARQVTFGSGWDSHPTWSPDGRFIAYAHLWPWRAELVVHSLESGGERTLYVVNTDPSESLSLPLEEQKEIGQMAWRPNASEIVFLVKTDQYSAHLWSVPLGADGRAKQLTRGVGMTESSFAIAPDGQQAAVEWVQRGATDLFIVTLDSALSRRVTSTTDEEFSVQWSRDGKSLVYVARDNGIDRVIVRDVATGTGRTVFESAFDGKQLSLLPDGSAAVMVAARRLHQLDLRTGRLTPIPVRATFRLSERSPGNLLLSNVRLWDGTGTPVRNSSWVLVRDGRIARVGRGPVSPADAAGVATIDGAGRFMLPGLMDNHYHLTGALFDAPRRLAMGVTTVRDPGTELAEALNFRAAMRLGVIEGPDLYTTGPLIDGPCGWHPTVDVLLDRPEAGPALVRALKAQGVDAIKLLPCLRPEVLRGVVAEARRLGLPVTGHVGNLTVWDEAVRAGVTGINHVDIYRWREPREPSELRGTPGRLQVRVPDDPDRPEVDSLLARMAGTGVAMDPTLQAFAVTDAERRELGLEEGERALSEWRMDQRFVKKVVDAGVMLLAGTDNRSLNDELENYEAAGVPREVILQSATVNGSKWLGKEAEFGMIQPGLRGHLLLVDGDPLKEMKDLRQVVLVVKDGRVVFRR
jgi:imidazolonepropionase-like amidohydrolase